MAGSHTATSRWCATVSGVKVPIWLTLGVAALVTGFGCYRVFLAFKKPVAQAPSDELSAASSAKPGASIMGGGIYRMSPRMHLAVGVIYILLGTALGATSFGWNPFAGVFG